VAILSHVAADAGYVLVIPIGGIMFYAAGRHPLAGIAAAFAGVSGGFSACFVPASLDPLLASLTTAGAQIVEPGRTVNPLCNFYFTGSSAILIILVGWFITDRVIEPRLSGTPVDGDPEHMPRMSDLSAADRRGMWAGLATILVTAVLLAAWAIPEQSALRGPDGSLTSPDAPLMQGIVPLIFFFFVLPGLVHGFVSGSFRNHRDAVKGMSKAMESMAYYLVLVFFAALFIDAFTESNIGKLVALQGAGLIQRTNAPPAVTIICIILMTTSINLLIGSASAKWAMLAPIFVPMLMYVGLAPELTQAAYRVGDSSTNIITPLMPYFPLVVVFCQRYVRQTGIGTVAAMMLPYSVSFLVVWGTYLLVYWSIGVPLGIQAEYTYTPPVQAVP
jgi:aminobenzoyl-glutamate transport protein